MTHTTTSRRLPVSVKRRIAANAAMLSERIDWVLHQIHRPNKPQRPETVDNMRAWMHAFSRGDEQAFERRLTWDGLDMESAWDVVTGQDDASDVSLPTWLDWLDRIVEESPMVREDFSSGRLEEASATAWSDEPPFVELWVAPLRAARHALVGRIPESALKRVTHTALQALDQQLVRDVSHWGARATLERFRAALDDSRAEHGGADPSQAYTTFIDSMLAAGLEPLWAAFPVLARQVSIVMAGCVDTTAELLERLDADWMALTSNFADGRDPGPVVSIAPGLSDPHCGRRRVAALEFESGLRVIYKPRDLALDRTFSDFLSWAAAHGLPAAPRSLEVLERDGYGWVEFVRPEDLDTRERAQGYYRRGGSLLCLTHLLRGNDLHMENVIATCAGPVTIDIEPLLQPVTTARLRELDADAASPSHDPTESCLGTGLLSLFEIGPDGSVFDVGGLRGDGKGAVPLPLLAWKDLRTANIDFTEETQFAVEVKNRVAVRGVAQLADDYADEIVGGFSDAYRWMLDHRADLLRTDGPLAAFARCRTRVIARPTNEYTTLGALFATPHYQRDGAIGAGALDSLLRSFSGNSARPAGWPALVAERHALEALDVPYFWVPCDSVEVYAGGQPILSNYFGRSGLQAVMDRLAGCSDEDRLWQERLLGRVLTESPRSRLMSPLVASPIVPKGVDSRLAPFVDVAIWLANEIRRRAVRARSGPTWPPLVARRSTICPHSLYDGTVGVALFYAALYRVTGQDEWADFCRAALESVWESLGRDDAATWTESGIGIGDGLGSMIYGLTLIGSWLDDRRSLDHARRLASVVAERIDRDECDDVLSGAAGGALALLALNHVRPDTALLAWADSCATRLLARQVFVDDGSAWPISDGRRLVGFAHGAAGIAYALDRVFQASAAASVGEAAARGFRFVRRQFLPREGNWPVSASSSDRSDGGTSLVAWCHGAPGVVMAEMLAPSRSTTSVVTPDIEAALATSAALLPGRGDYLCCGALGR
ncbi:MAG TPA: type 2 lanthipeptide synthetase LanM family protein, partial [Vicinamibacterales bacterium]|nr:type 2 lanthipeptide synthetase LanM family protein [Vicinamibacterales bacterium]